MALINDVRFDEAYVGLVRESRLYEASLQEAASLTAHQCATTLQASRASVWLLSDDQTQLSCLSLYIADDDRFESGVVIDAESFPNYFDALLNQRVIDAGDAFDDPQTRELRDSYLVPLNVRALLDASLRRDGNVQGVLCVEQVGNTRNWSQPEQAFVASVADLMTQRLIMEQLKTSERNLHALFDTSTEGILVFGDGLFVDANPAACLMFGGTREQLLGKSAIELSPEFQSDGMSSEEKGRLIFENCKNGESQHFEWTHLRLDGTEFEADVLLSPVKFGGEDTLFASVRDITARKDAERAAQLAQKQMEYRASHDSLTGLRNREQLHKHVDDMIAAAKEASCDINIALVLLDLNRFKEINDTLGHATGDKVLVSLSAVLRTQVMELGGEVFRLGADEFVAVFDTQSCTEDFARAEKILGQCMRTPIEVDDICVELGASMGIATYPEIGSDSFELLRCADVAMYHAKSTDGASSWYSAAIDGHNKRRLSMMVELGTAIRDDQLLLHFQPRIDLRNGEVVGFEALVRWQHPKLGLVPPGEFMPLAEMGELIHPLSAWVLRNACMESKRLRAKGYRLPIAINVSARNLTDSQFVDCLQSLLDTEGMQPGWLEIEITESALINHPQRAVQNLERINSLGVPIAIDDFGTGYSSLSYLKSLPLNTLKIDRSFVMQMLSDDSDSVIVDSTINLAHNFSLTVVAEGVEDQETLEALGAKRCDQAQGFFISRPMPACELIDWIQGYYGQGFDESIAV